MDQVLLFLLLLPSTSVLPLPIFELILCSSHVVAVVAAAAPTAADDDDDDHLLDSEIVFRRIT